MPVQGKTQRFLDDQIIEGRKASGKKWGDSLVLSLAADFNSPKSKLKAPDRTQLEVALSKPVGSDERQRIEHQLFEMLDTAVQIGKAIPEILDKKDQERSAIEMSIKVSDDYVITLNSGKRNGEESVSIAVGNKTYKLGKTVSEIGSLLPPPGQAELELEFADDSPLGQDTLKSKLPEFEEIKEMQNLTGEELRNALPELSKHIHSAIDNFFGGIARIVNKPENKAKYAEAIGQTVEDIEDWDDNTLFPTHIYLNGIETNNEFKQKVRLRLDLDLKGQLDSISILNETEDNDMREISFDEIDFDEMLEAREELLGEPDNITSLEELRDSSTTHTDKNNPANRASLFEAETTSLKNAYEKIYEAVLEEIENHVRWNQKLPANNFMPGASLLRLKINDEIYNISITYNYIDDEGKLSGELKDPKNWKHEVANLSIDLYSEDEQISIASTGRVEEAQMDSIRFQDRDEHEGVILLDSDGYVMLKDCLHDPSIYLSKDKYVSLPNS